MAHFRGHSGDIMSVLYVIYIWITLLATNTVVADTGWYVGCYNVTSLNVTSQSDNVTSPVECARRCYNERSDYAAISSSLSCSCVNVNLTDIKALDSSLCHSRCSPDSILLCGGDSPGTASVYNTSGPYLLRIHPQNGTTVYQGQLFDITATVMFAGNPNMSLGISTSHYIAPYDVRIEWRPQPHDDSNVINRREFDTMFTVSQMFKFNGEGVFEIEMTVSNSLSMVTTTIEVHVLLAPPTSLDVTPIQTLWQPECTPQHLHQPGDGTSPPVRVFTSTPVTIEASVLIGVNLTFSWTLLGNESRDVMSPSCHGESCLTSFKKHEFPEEGVYSIHVNVSNSLGWLQKTIKLLAIRPALNNLTITSLTGHVLTHSDPALFKVTLTTTSRSNLTLSLMYGDGSEDSKQAYNLSALNSDTTSQRVVIVGSYGDGCVLGVKVEYQYKKEGTYRVTAEAQWSDMTTRGVLEQDMVIQEEIARPRVETTPASQGFAVNATIIFNLVFLKPLQNVTHEWALIRLNDNTHAHKNMTSASPVPESPLQILTTTDTRWNCSMASPGLYKVKVKSYNLVSEVSEEVYIYVDIPLKGLYLQAPYPDIAAVGDEVTFGATLAQGGSDVTYTWYFDVINDTMILPDLSLHCRFNYEFDVPGEFNVTLIANNSVNNVTKSFKYVVLEPVTNLTFKANHAVVKGNKFVIEACVDSGTDVKFYVDFGDGEGKQWLNEIPSALSVTTTHKYVTTGIYDVTVYAENPVSRDSVCFEVVVEETLRKMALEVIGPHLAEENVTFVLKNLKADNLTRYNLHILYDWYINDTLVHQTRWPVSSHIFSQGGVYNVTVYAHNFVHNQTVTRVLDVTTWTHKTRFDIAPYVDREHKAYFIVKGGPSLYNLTMAIHYGDYSTNSVTTFSGWEHQYSEPGIYEVVGNLSSDEELRTVVACQDAVKGLSIEGPLYIPADSVDVKYILRAKVNKGTALIYNWSVDENSHHYITTYDRFVHSFSGIGPHNVTVNATNGVSNKMATTVVNVIQKILHVTMAISPVVQGNPTEIALNITGNEPFNFTAKYGQGASSINANVSRVSCDPLNSENTSYPVHHCVISLGVLPGDGEYNVTVNASNPVSYSVQSKTAIVGEAISGVTMDVRNITGNNLVEVDKEFEVIATVASGRNLNFTWDFGGTGLKFNKVETMHNSSKATHVYVEPGTYNVSVSITNPLYTRRYAPVVKYLDRPVKCIERIGGLQLTLLGVKKVGDEYVAPILNPQGTGKLKFKAKVTQGSDVTFTFDYGDGMTQDVLGMLNGSHVEGIGEYEFTSATESGTYITIRVNATNPLNSTNNWPRQASIRLRVQKPPSGLTFMQSQYTSVWGKGIQFVTVVAGGTSLKHDWEFGDGSRIEHGQTVVNHTYNTPGNYTVRVTAYNDVGNDTATATVIIEYVLQGVELTVINSRVYTPSDPVILRATPHPNTQAGLVRKYTWYLGRTAQGQHITKINYSPILEWQYETPNKYYVTVTAHSEFRNVTSSSVLVHVVLALEGTLGVEWFESVPVVGASMKFEAWIFSGTDITYSWDFGDGHKESRNGTDTILHAYQTVGVYIVKCVASNPVSSKNKSIAVFITEKLCLQPQVRLVTVKNKLWFQRSGEIRVEAEVFINCSMTSVTQYEWLISSAGSSSSGKQWVIHDPVLVLPPRSLLYGIHNVTITVSMRNTSIPVYGSYEDYQDLEDGLVASYFNTDDLSVRPTMPISGRSRAELNVTESPLLAMISGGNMRQVHRDEIVVMDATGSRDPDFPEIPLVYNWTCYNFSSTYQNVPCFGESTRTILNSKNNISFSAASFIQNASEFQFILTVRQGDRNATVSQVVRVEAGRILKVSVGCTECSKHLVNGDDRLILQANHPTGNHSLYEYQWQLYVVGVVNPRNRLECRQVVQVDDDSKIWAFQVPKDTTTTTTKVSTAKSTVSSTTTQPTTKLTLEPTTKPTTESSTVTEPTSATNTGNPVNPGGGGNPFNPEESGNPLNPNEGGDPLNPGEGGNPLNPNEGGNPLNPSEGNPFVPNEGENPVDSKEVITPGPSTLPPNLIFPIEENSQSNEGGNPLVPVEENPSNPVEENPSNHGDGNPFPVEENPASEFNGGLFPQPSEGENPVPNDGGTPLDSNEEQQSQSNEQTTQEPDIDQNPMLPVEENSQSSERGNSLSPVEDNPPSDGGVNPFPVEENSPSDGNGGLFPQPSEGEDPIVPSDGETPMNTNEGQSSPSNEPSTLPPSPMFPVEENSQSNEGGNFPFPVEENPSSDGGGIPVNPEEDSPDDGGVNPLPPVEENPPSNVGGNPIPPVEENPTSNGGVGGPPLNPDEEDTPPNNGGGNPFPVEEDNSPEVGGNPSPGGNPSTGGNPFGDGGLNPIEGEDGGLGPGADHSPPPRPSTTPASEQGGGAVDNNLDFGTVTHVLSEQRTNINLRAEDTVMGTNHRSLVLKPGVLTQGQRYMVQVNVKDNKSGITGSAISADFVVNTSPEDGKCSLQPTQGREMETQFNVYCADWQDPDERGPVRYEVSYTLSPEQPREIVYQGLSQAIKFTLPAGLPENDHKVTIHMSVLDSLWGRTSVCSIDVTVTPQQVNTTLHSEEEVLYGLVEEWASALTTFVQEGDNRKARLHTQMVATRLNRLDDVTTDTSRVTIRKRIRRAILWHLKDLPIRDEYEIQQTTSAVTSSTARAHELTNDCLEYASEILDRASERVVNTPATSQGMDNTLATVTIHATSNILGAVTMVNVTSSSARDIVTRSTQAIHRVLNAEVRHMVTEEEPVVRSASTFKAQATKYNRDTSPNIQSDAANFVLPSNMDTVLANHVQVMNKSDPISGEEDCYQSHVVSYMVNPYMYATDLAEGQVQSNVASLSLYTCRGEELAVNHLPPTSEITIEIPLIVTSQEVNNTHVLDKHMMNIHELNTTRDMVSNTLHINIDLLPVTTGRLFPIAVLIREDETPTPRHHDFKYTYDAGHDYIHIFLPPHTLRAGSRYYLGVVDAKFNAGRPRQGEIRSRDYKLKVWSGDCVYWDTTTDTWSSEGCRIKQTSTYALAHCSCNHLTSFGAQFSLAPNDLDFTNVDIFFELSANPVCYALIVALLLAYIVLLIPAIKYDRHDENKGAIIQLIDNNPVHRQRYVVTFETGYRKGAGTTAKVSLVLHGEEGVLDTQELVSQRGQSIFDRNSRDTFIITHHESLGPIFKIQVWHNNAGESPSWYLSRVTVKDVNAGATYYFSCEKWFAAEEEDGKVDREILALEGGLGLWKVLWAKGTQYFMDYHLWFSSFTRPSYSRFTRAQRLTCCLSLIMSYMAVNAAWYTRTVEEYRGEFGLIDLSWRAVYVGCVTSVIVLPVNYLIIFIFRRSKMYKLNYDAPERKSKSSADSTNSLESTAQLLPGEDTHSIFDQTILTWQSMQEWAQKIWAKRYHNSPNASVNDVQPVTVHTNEKMEKHGSLKPIKDPEKKLPSNDTHNEADLHQVNLEHKQQEQIMNKKNVERQHSDPASPRISKPMSDHIKCNDGLTRKSSEKSFSSDRSTTVSTGSTNSDMSAAELHSAFLDSLRSQKKDRCFCPYICQYFAWFLAFLVIAGSGAVTILYGIQFGRIKSILWLQSLFFSFVQCVFVTHPVIITLITLFVAALYRNSMKIFEHHNDGEIETKKQKEETKKMVKFAECVEEEEVDFDEGIAIRQRNRYLRFARPPQEKQLIKARKETIKQKKALSVFNQTTLFVLMFILLAFMAYGKDTSTPHHLNHSLRHTFTPTFTQVRTVGDFWRWMKDDFVDLVYEEDLPGHETDNRVIQNSVMIGDVNIRQQRSESTTCHLPLIFTPIDLTPRLCQRLSKGGGAYMRQAFGENDSYIHEDDLGSGPIFGNHGYYQEKGYLVVLGKERSTVIRQLTALEEDTWINRHTDVVMVEFTLYHAPSSLFSTITLLAESPPSGGLFTNIRVSSAYLYKYLTWFDNVVLAAEILFIVAVLLKIRDELMELMRVKGDYRRDPWCCVNFTFCVVSLAFIGCYVYRFVVVIETVELMRETYREEYVSVAPVALVDQILRTIIGILLFLMILQSLRLLRHRPVFARFGNVFKMAAMDILTFMCMFGIWVCAYVSLGMALFQSVTPRFHHVDSSILSILGLFVGHYPFLEMETQNSSQTLVWRLFTVSLLVFALGSMTAYIIAVLSYHYRRSKVRGVLVYNVWETMEFYWHRLMLFLGVRIPPPPPEEDTKLPAEFTMAEIEYQVEEMFFKMNALAGTANLPEKPVMYFTDSDGTYDGMSAFDDERLEHRIHKIEDNLYSHEPHLAQLIQYNHQYNKIDTKILGHEKEKHLRTQLELEIFRQLQMERQDLHLTGSSDTYPSSVSMHDMPSSGSYHSNSQSSGGGGHSPGDHSPVIFHHERSPRMCLSKMPTLVPLFPPMEEGDEDVNIELDDELSGSSTTEYEDDTLEVTATVHGPDVPICHDIIIDGVTMDSDVTGSRDMTQPKVLSMSEGLLLQEGRKEGEEASQDIPLQDMGRLHREGTGSMPNVKDLSEKETPIGQGNISTGSSSSGGAEIKALFSTNQNNAPISASTNQVTANVKTDIHPKQSNKLSTSPGRPPLKQKSASELYIKTDKSQKNFTDSNKIKPKSKSDLHAFSFDAMYDSSSISDRESVASSNVSKPRTLRKTKSRGKGKGMRGGRGSPGLEDFVFENVAFSSEDEEKQRRKYIPGVTHKECW